MSSAASCGKSPLEEGDVGGLPQTVVAQYRLLLNPGAESRQAGSTRGPIAGDAESIQEGDIHVTLGKRASAVTGCGAGGAPKGSALPGNTIGPSESDDNARLARNKSPTPPAPQQGSRGSAGTGRVTLLSNTSFHASGSNCSTPLLLPQQTQPSTLAAVPSLALSDSNPSAAAVQSYAQRTAIEAGSGPKKLAPARPSGVIPADSSASLNATPAPSASLAARGIPAQKKVGPSGVSKAVSDTIICDDPNLLMCGFYSINSSAVKANESSSSHHNLVTNARSRLPPQKALALNTSNAAPNDADSISVDFNMSTELTNEVRSGVLSPTIPITKGATATQQEDAKTIGARRTAGDAEAFRGADAPKPCGNTPLELGAGAVLAKGPQLHAAAAPAPAFVTTLIPQPLPTSTFLYVLTTSEGRDKMCKFVQYILKLFISILQIDNLLPPDAERFKEYWCERFRANVQTIRNGRALFKLGRWIVTGMHLYDACDRYLQQRAARRAENAAKAKMREEPLSAGGHKSVSFRDRKGAAGNDDETSPRSLFCPEPLSTAPEESAPDERLAQSGSESQHVFFKGTGAPALFQPPEAAMPRACRKPILEFPRWGMILLIIRSVLSILRNIARDLIFLSDKELLGFQTAGGAVRLCAAGMMLSLPWQRAAMQSFANKAWFVVALIDSLLNLTRLLDFGWMEGALVPEANKYCLCSLVVAGHTTNGDILCEKSPSFLRRTASTFYPKLDMDFGSVTPISAKFFEAAPPSTMRECCADCGYLLQPMPEAGRGQQRRESSNSDKSSDETAPPINRTRASSDDLVKAGDAYPAPPADERHLMLFPHLLRRVYSYLWCCYTHDNFFHTVALQARYFSDLFLASGYVFGHYEPVTEIPIEDLTTKVRSAYAAVTAAAIAAQSARRASFVGTSNVPVSVDPARVITDMAGSAFTPTGAAYAENRSSQRVQLLGSIAGLVSSGVALWRVLKAAA